MHSIGMKKSFGKKHLAILALSALAIAAVWLIAGRGATEESDSSALSRHTTMATRWKALADQGVREKPVFKTWPFAAFRGPSRAMPTDRREASASTLGEPDPLGLDFDQARYAMSRARVGLWMVPGRGVTCLIKGGIVAATCDTTSNTERKGLSLEVFKPGPPPKRRPTHFLALGVVPNGVKGLRVRVGKRTSVISVSDNTYSMRAEVPIQIVSLIR